MIDSTTSSGAETERLERHAHTLRVIAAYRRIHFGVLTAITVVTSRERRTNEDDYEAIRRFNGHSR